MRLALGIASLASLAALAAAVQAAEQMIPVPAAVIYAGEAMDEAALSDELFNVPEGAEGRFVIAREQLRGLYAKRALLPGKPIALSYLKPKEAVLKGIPTRATYSVAGVSISTLLVPLQTGSIGDIIDARNPEAGTTVKVRIGEDGALLVGP